MKQIFEYVLNNYQEILGGSLAVYEFLVRVIPTVKNYSFVSKLVAIIRAIDEFLNVKPKK